VGSDCESENCYPNLRPWEASTLGLIRKRYELSYTADMLDDRLSCAFCADIYLHFDNPHDVEERTNSLSEGT
jgi:hypothetical protein